MIQILIDLYFTGYLLGFLVILWAVPGTAYDEWECRGRLGMQVLASLRIAFAWPFIVFVLWERRHGL